MLLSQEVTRATGAGRIPRPIGAQAQVPRHRFALGLMVEGAQWTIVNSGMPAESAMEPIPQGFAATPPPSPRIISAPTPMPPL